MSLSGLKRFQVSSWRGSVIVDQVLNSIDSVEFGMRYLALGLIWLALLGPASAKTQFDGIWDVAIVTNAGSCEPSSHYMLTVQDGRVSGVGDVSGRVTPDGYVRVSISGSYANGQLEGRSGFGRWSAASSGAPCSGKWRATRQ